MTYLQHLAIVHTKDEAAFQTSSTRSLPSRLPLGYTQLRPPPTTPLLIFKPPLSSGDSRHTYTFAC
jgi:hypothetical protein